MPASVLSLLSTDMPKMLLLFESTMDFTPVGGNWKIKDEIRAMASFQQMNLMQPFSGLGKFDIIFCRNVAIYFTLQDRKKLFNKIADVLEPDGYLLIGSTESLGVFKGSPSYRLFRFQINHSHHHSGSA